VNTVEQVKIDRFTRRYRRGFINSLLEYIIISNISDTAMCGYDILAFVHDRFNVLLSPGQVYPVIDCLAKDGIIQKQAEGRRVMLKLTSSGKLLLKAWKHEHVLMQLQLNDLLAKIESSA
jgi:DNA-binding PadR family transcriptional regulator